MQVFKEEEEEEENALKCNFIYALEFFVAVVALIFYVETKIKCSCVQRHFKAHPRFTIDIILHFLLHKTVPLQIFQILH